MNQNFPNTLENLCCYLNPDYFKAGFVNASSTQSKNKLEKLMSGIIEVKGFDNLVIRMDDFDWVAGVQNRSWWWQIQALPYLNDFIDTCSEISSKEHEDYLLLTKSIILSWIKKASENNNSPLAWHDHATAYRLRNIIRWLAYVYNANCLDYIKKDEKKSILATIYKHIDWLKKEENYSKHTNHGFDQMLVLYRVCLIFSKPEFLHHIQELSQYRLLDELSFSFTEEGVHKENSPGYQQFMLARIKELTKLNVLGDRHVSSEAQQLVSRAEQFLHAITLPNNKIPIIGDTQSIYSNLSISSSRDINPHIQIIDYSNSGYIILKGVNIYNDEFHLIFKSSHLSSYHRHDDDLSIHWYVNDEIIIGDSGLFSHEEKEHKRKYMRSHFAHSSPFINNITPERSPASLKELPTCSIDQETKVIKSTSTSFSGITLRRVIDYSEIIYNILTIEDSILTPSDESLCINFVFPEKEATLALCNNRISSNSLKNTTIIESNNELSISTFFGIGSNLSNTAIASYEFNKYHSCYRASLQPTNKIKSKVKIQSTPNIHTLRLNDDIFLGDIKRLNVYSSTNDLLIIENKNNYDCYLTPYNDDFSFEKTNRNHIKAPNCRITFVFDASSNDVTPELIIIFYGKDNNKTKSFRINALSEEQIKVPKNALSFKLYIKIPKLSECCISKLSWAIDNR